MTTQAPSIDDVPEGLGAALRAQGFDTLTSVQAAVLAPEVAGKDLRISSQTGSGKTVALGLLLANHVAEAAKGPRRNRLPAEPIALLIAPTRELAGQLSRELAWLYKSLDARVAVVTGGTHMGREKDELRRDPHVLIGTPGRLLDHLRSGNIDLSKLRAVALDEADEMLAMNFEEDLNAILALAPAERTTHLVSATFPHEVRRMAERLQRDAVLVEGTALGQANTDIEHQVMWVEPRFRYDAVINILLRHPEDKAILFVRTRADTNELAYALNSAGIRARALSGEMTQAERTQTFSAFRTEGPWVLVATDVAARGLDVQDIARVIQVDLPENGDVLTHRSGRTGRAGRRGTNILIAPPRAGGRLRSLVRAAGVEVKERPVPTREEILRAADERLLAEVPADLGAALGDKANGDAELGDAANGALVGGEDAARVRALGERMLEGRDPADVVAWLLARGGAVSSSAARDVAPAKGPPSKQGKNDARGDSRSHARGDSRGDSRGAPRGRGGRDGGRGGEEFITYQVSWGAMLGADVRRILAMVCRRGDITHAEVGAIHVSQKSSTVDIAARVAAEFEVAVERPDDRPPKARFRRWNPDAARGAKGEGAPRKEFRGREGAQKGKAPRKPGRPRKVGPKAKHAPLHDLAAS